MKLRPFSLPASRYEGFGRVRVDVEPLARDGAAPPPPPRELDSRWTLRRSVPVEFDLERVRVRGPCRVTLTPAGDAAKLAVTAIGLKRADADEAGEDESALCGAARGGGGIVQQRGGD